MDHMGHAWPIWSTILKIFLFGGPYGPGGDYNLGRPRQIQCANEVHFSLRIISSRVRVRQKHVVEIQKMFSLVGCNKYHFERITYVRIARIVYFSEH